MSTDQMSIRLPFGNHGQEETQEGVAGIHPALMETNPDPMGSDNASPFLENHHPGQLNRHLTSQAYMGPMGFAGLQELIEDLLDKFLGHTLRVHDDFAILDGEQDDSETEALGLPV